MGEWPCKGTFGLKMGFWGEMAMQRDFWVKDGVWEKIAVQRVFGLKMGFGLNGILEENGRAKGLLGKKIGSLLCKETFGLKVGFQGKMG